MFDLAWITLYDDERRELDAIDRAIDCKQSEAFMAWDNGLTAQFWQLVGDIDHLLSERDTAPFELEIIW